MLSPIVPSFQSGVLAVVVLRAARVLVRAGERILPAMSGKRIAARDEDASAGSICDVPGICVGHWTDRRALTGCTVVLPGRPATAGVDVRGGAPGTQENDAEAASDPGVEVFAVDNGS